jgi:hypothetical protein
MKVAASAPRALRARHWAIAAIAAIAALAMWATLARAADPAPYGEVTRWGGADATGDRRIGLPVGFAADPVDDSVYVVDVDSRDDTTGTARFRVRKFAGANGEVTATGSFESTSAQPGAAPAVAGVVVDPETRRLYISLVEPRAAVSDVALKQVQVFDTVADGSRQLNAPSDVSDGTLLGTVPDMIKNAVIAVDPRSHDVVLAGISNPDGNAIVARFHGSSDSEATPGAADGTWTDTNQFMPIGVTVNADSVVYVETTVGFAFLPVLVTRVPADLDPANATMIMPTAAQGGPDLGGIIAGDPPDHDFSTLAFGSRAFGAPLSVALDGSLLASTAGMSLLFSGVTEPFSSSGAGVLGVRRLTPDGEDAGVVAGGAAIPGGEDSATCAINLVSGTNGTGTTVGAYGLSPGANGKIFVPSWLPGGTVEMTVFGPGGEGCPVPEPSLVVRKRDGSVAADGVVPVGDDVTLDLSGSDLRWSLVQVEWDLDGAPGFEVVERRPTITDDPGTPAPSLIHTVRFATAGDHTVRARIVTTAGVAEISTTVRAAGAALAPTASLTGSQLRTVGDTVTFDASGSRAQPEGSGATLRYEWSFGDAGDTFVPGFVRQTHVYSSAGRYSVRVRVTDTAAGNGRSTVSAPFSIVIRAATVVPPDDRRTVITPPPPQTTPTTPTTLVPPPPPADTTAPVVTLKATTAVPSSGALALQVGCPTGESTCSGSIEVRTASAVAATAAAKKRAARAKRRVLVLGRASFSAAGGRTARVTVKLSAAGRRLLARAKKLKVVVTIVARDAAGNAKTTTKSLTLTVARAARRSSRKKR